MVTITIALMEYRSIAISDNTISLNSPLLPDSSLVERKLITLKDVPINPSTLTRPRANHREKSARLKLSLQSWLDLAAGLQPLLSLGLHTLADLCVGRICCRRTWLLSSPADVRSVVCLVPSSEGSSIDLHDGRFGEGIGSDQFVVGRMICDDDDADLAGDTLAAPREIAGFEAQGTVFSVAAAGADEMDALGTNASVGWLATFLEGSLLAVVGALCTGGRPLVTAVS